MKIRSNPNLSILLVALLIGVAPALFSQSADSLSPKIYPVIPNLTEEEFRFTQADFFPLSLAEKGRLSSAAFRGMPPGFFELSFKGIALENPVIGFWNEQWIPHWRIQQRRTSPFGFREELSSLPPGGYKPETRVTYFETNLSYLDIDFSEYVTKKSYIRLGGNNFLREGPYPFGFSRIHVNTYQAQAHLELFEGWSLDASYWQMRHRFNMTPEGLTTQSDRFRQIGHTAWFRLTGKISQRDSIMFAPNYTVADDDYWQAGVRTREMWYEWGGGELGYFRKFSRGFLGAQVNSRYVATHGKRIFHDQKEGDGGGLLMAGWRSRYLNVEAQAGAYKHSELGERLQGALHAGIKFKRLGRIGVRLFSKPQAVPLAWRTVQHDSIPALRGEELIEKQGASFYGQMNYRNWLLLRVEPFTYRTQNYPVFDDNSWEIKSIENYGVHFLAGLKLWQFRLQNDFTYNHNYEESFAPEVNNVSTAKSSLSLFKGALEFEGILIWHVLSYYRLMTFDRPLQQYRITGTQAGPFHLVDFKLQAHISRFTLFLVWENLLSEDYSIVDDNLTQFRVFRFGLHWLLFD